MKTYNAHIGFVSPPRNIKTRLLGTFDAPSGDAAIAKAGELAREQEAQGTVQVTVA